MGLGEFLSSKAMNEYMALQRKRGEWQLGHNREVGVWIPNQGFLLSWRKEGHLLGANTPWAVDFVDVIPWM